MLDHQDQMALISQFYPGGVHVYTEVVSQQGESKVARRRRRKNKIGGGGGGGGGGGAAKKRKLSAHQVNLLEQNFGDERKLESERKDKLALELGLDPRQVAVWFQNRRARWKNKKLEEEYTKMKTAHETMVVQKCQLESEVLKLKEQLNEAEREIQRLSERVDGVVLFTSSPGTSSLSMAMDPPFLGEFAIDHGYEDAFYMPPAAENNYVNPGMEWINLYMY